MLAACLPESLLPAWFRGSAEDDKKEPHHVEDNPNAGVVANSARDAVSAGYRAWTDAFDKKNFAAIALLYSLDCKVCPSGSRSAYGRQECKTGWESLLQTGVHRVSFSDTSIEACGGDPDAIAETSNYHMYGFDNKPIDGGKHMMIWKRIRGKWFIHLHVFSSNKTRQKTARDHVIEACSMWEHNFYSRDFVELQNLYSESCILCPPAWPQVEGNLPTQRFWSRFPSMGVDHVHREAIDVEDMGPGYIHAEIRYTMYDYRKGVIDIGKAMVIFKKSTDGRWCIHHEQFNSDSALPSVSTEDETSPKHVTLKSTNEATNLAFSSEA